MHQMLDAQKLLAEATCGMQRGEVVVAKIAALEERDSEGIADGHRDGSASGRREIERAGLFADADVENDVAGFGKGGMEVTGEGDERDFQSFQSFEQGNDFLGLATVGDSQDGVAPSEHSQVAVESFGGMQEKGRRASAGKRARN